MDKCLIEELIAEFYEIYNRGHKLVEQYEDIQTIIMGNGWYEYRVYKRNRLIRIEECANA